MRNQKILILVATNLRILSIFKPILNPTEDETLRKRLIDSFFYTIKTLNN